jgi:sec-independent protein translocase protein TatB
MLSLSPAKLLVILVIALIVLGPEKLPQVARQLGAAWHDLRQWRSRIEGEVRDTFPSLPPTHEVAQAVRSPLAFLDRLADEHERTLSEETPDTADAPIAGDDALAPGAGPPSDGVPGSIGDQSSAVTAGNGSVPGNGTLASNGSGSGSSTPPDEAALPDAHAGPAARPVAPDDPSMN